MKKIYSSLFLCAVVLSQALADKPDKIVGAVRNAVDNRCMPQCRVLLLLDDDILDEKLTDAQGAFAFYRLDTGSYVVKVEFNDYKTVEHIVEIEQPNNVTHSLTIYMQSSIQPIAKAELKDYPMRSDYEHFLLNYHFKHYQTDSTMLLSSISSCVWNEAHQLLYIHVLEVDVNVHGDVTILPESELLGVYEVVPDEMLASPTPPKEEEKKKWMVVLDRLGKAAEKVVLENPDVLRMGK